MIGSCVVGRQMFSTNRETRGASLIWRFVGNMPFAAHNITSPIGMTAAAHVCVKDARTGPEFDDIVARKYGAIDANQIFMGDMKFA